MAAKLRRDTDMTSGSIIRHLLIFAVPLLLGNIFQQLYNTVDSVVVGNYVGKEALAAVGGVAPVINMLIGLFTGLATGAGVVISQYYGAHDDKRVEQAVHTFFALTLILCVVLTVAGTLLVPLMLKMMKTPLDVETEAAEYLRIYFLGLSGLLLYNTGAGVLRAVGDSKRPLYFLTFSAVTNTVLDLLFVARFRMGIAGAAYATILAQGLSAVLVIVTLCRSAGACRLQVRKLRLHGECLKRICAVGLPSALQMSITSFSNVFVQSYINRFGSACMAGWTTYQKIDAFALVPIMTLGMSVTTFVGQNLGACNPSRARSGTRTAWLMSLIITVVILIPLMIFAPQLAYLFNQDPEVLKYGTLFLRLGSPFYLVLTVNQIYSGALRGAGRTRIPMFITLGSFVAFRQIYLFIVYRTVGELIPVALGYPLGWLLCSGLILIYYRHVDRQLHAQVGKM